MANSQSAPYLAAVVRAPVGAASEQEDLEAVRAKNAARVVRMIDAICTLISPRPRLIVYPVLCLTSGSRKDGPYPAADVAIELPGEPFAPILDACRRNNVYFVSSTQEKVAALPGMVFHTGFVFGPEGLVLRSPKAQALSVAGVLSIRECYGAYLAAFGEDPILPVVQTPIGAIGCLVEAEVLVPEASRLLAAKGAEIIVHPSGERGGEHAPPYTAARQLNAYANGVYWLTAVRSRVTSPGFDDVWLDSAAAIVRPDGGFEAHLTGRAEGFAAGLIDLAQVNEARARQERETRPAGILYRGLYDRFV